MKKGFVYINDNVIESYFAVTEEEQQKGLMFVTGLPPVMSFIYSTAKDNKFWMLNTPSELDIVFCKDNVVQEICHGKPFSTEILGSKKSDLVIELPFGTVKKSNIKIGDKVGILK